MRKLCLGLLLSASFGCGSAPKDPEVALPDDAVDREIASLSASAPAATARRTTCAWP